MESAFYELVNEFDKAVMYATVHPQGSAMIILGTICVLLVAIVLIIAYDRFQMDKIMGNAANDAIEVTTSEAMFMTIIGVACLSLSVATVIWYLKASDINILKLFLTAVRY